MSRDQVEFLRFNELPAIAWMPQGRFAGLRASSLSLDSETGAETLLVTVSAFWRWGEPVYWRHDVELLILDGDLSIQGHELRAGHYVFWPAYLACGGFSSRSGARLIWMAGDRCEERSLVGDELQLIDVRTRPWTLSPAYAGRSVEDAGPDLGVRLLREDTRTGAYTLMTRHAPGWFDARLEAHDTWEELVLLEGDYLMGETGAIVAGTYIFRPGSRPHGPQATRGGAIWFCRGEKRIDFRFTEVPWADAQIKSYFDGPAVQAGYWNV